ncbi:MarR family winged helix-turn-helix transcriptional regulator [Tistrella mobilis]|uniref:MarR family winged helix-turn-helix transcriptional regulator n=1 Tax=Tistrella mobilis TaxID=171437 RepID=UPI0035577529
MSDIPRDPFRPDLPERAPLGDLSDTTAAAHRVAQLFFFAHRGFTGDADSFLREHGLGRAHYRVLYFAARLPGITVGELLDILGITAQGVARVLNRLLDDGLLRQETDRGDRRRRRLYLTDAGVRMERAAFACQEAVISAAIRAAGPGHADDFSTIMMALARPEDRPLLARVMAAIGEGDGGS